MIAIMEEILYVDDEWGGCKLASWKYGTNVVVGGIDDAVDAIISGMADAKPNPNCHHIFKDTSCDGC